MKSFKYIMFVLMVSSFSNDISGNVPGIANAVFNHLIDIIHKVRCGPY